MAAAFASPVEQQDFQFHIIIAQHWCGCLPGLAGDEVAEGEAGGGGVVEGFGDGVGSAYVVGKAGGGSVIFGNKGRQRYHVGAPAF